jgi:hypothetical protein
VEQSQGRDPRSLHLLAAAYRHSGDAARADATERLAATLVRLSQR